jgi:hypothetical protein
MSRQIPAVRASIVALALSVAACNGGTLGPPLADANAVITAALKASEAATSVHVQIAIDGETAVALPIGGAGGPVDLTGTTISGDLDMANSAARLTFSMPGLLNLSGELIAVGGKAYLKTTITGAQYRAVDLGSTLPVDPTDLNGMIGGLGDLLSKPGVDPVKGEDVSCGSKQCYTVNVDLDATELATLVGAAGQGLPIDLTGASLHMTLRVEKDLPYHLAGLSATLTTADGHEVTMDVTFSKWNEPVSITAPPADQVAPGG